MLICELCGQRILGEMHQTRLRGSLFIVCEKCFKSSSRVRNNVVPLRKGIATRKSESRTLSTKAKYEDKLEPIPNLGKIIMEKRASLGLSIQELSTRVGIRESLIKKVESGKIMLPIQDLKKLERVLNVHLIKVSEEEELYKVDPKILSDRKDKSLTLGDLLNGG